MKPLKLLFALLLATQPVVLRAQADTSVFALLDLTRPGLERVAELHAAGSDPAAAEALLDYYRRRTGVVSPDVDLANISITPDEQRWADEAMEHRFFVHAGYHRLAILAREGQRTALAAPPDEVVGSDGQSLPPLG